MLSLDLTQPTSPRLEWLAGARDILPLVIGAIPFGLIFGTLSQGSGLSYAATLAMSALVFAGSSQFIALGLLAAGSSLPLMVLTTAVVNLRHLLYAASLVPYVQGLSARGKALMAFALTDEAFVVAIRRYHQVDPSPHKHWYYAGAATAMYGNWLLCTWVGLTVGTLIPNLASWGLDFAMVVTFIGMVVPYVTNRPMLATVLVAGTTALVFQGLPNQLGLMGAAIAGVIAGLAVDTQGTAVGKHSR